MDYFTDKGHLTDEGLSLYAEALKLDQMDQVPEALREHLEQCPRCQEEAMALYALIAGQDYSELGPHPSFVSNGNRTSASTLKMWFRPLLLLLMAVLALFLFLQQQKDQPPATEVQTPATTPSINADSLNSARSLSPPQAGVGGKTSKPEERTEGLMAKEEQNAESGIPNQTPQIENQTSQIKNLPPPIAANFAPSEALESLVGTVTRSHGLSEMKPSAGAELEIGEPVVFSWQSASDEPLTLRLLNNREEEVFSRVVEGNRLSCPVELQAGLYYWKLETLDDLVYVGQFFIGRQD
ncbi:MAG: hypothetical protein KDD06_15580 [Phaeodactylibacter sp.]|nr:hypothetical protein [Phaeodactylibacter sp.]MCB9265460.1 hypothetical protein [Lewinellaceae bacterium]MCB9289604.1 hypothetical protein [Lewinellaceae bacterium]